MCYFVTLGIAARQRSSVEALPSLRGGFNVQPATNPSVARLFPKEDALFVVTRGGCSCDLYSRPGLEPDASPGARDEDIARARYRRLGWSEAKVSRALEAKRLKAASRPHGGAAGEDSRVKFCGAVTALVEQAGLVRLFAHMFSGRIDTEDVGPGGRLRLSVEAFMSQGGAFPVDTVVEIVAGTGRS
jgi:hypothetical protein